MAYRLARCLDFGGKLMLAAAGMAVTAIGQTQQPAARTEFEVASIRLNAGDTNRAGDINRAYVQAIPGKLIMTNFSLRQLLLFAYGVQKYQLSEGVPWMDSDHYDIQAKVEGNASVQQMEGPMLQALLADRFKLVLHRQIRQLPVYELIVEKSGSKLQGTKQGDCVPFSMDSQPPTVTASGELHPTYCDFPKFGVDGLNRTLDGAGITMAKLAARLSGSDLGRTVIDETGLTGAFNLHLKWSIDTAAGLAGSASSEDPASPSIFTALKEELGLKLESARGPVEVLVIDHIEKPSEN